MSPDFSREVYCVLGLPFDAIDTAGAVAHVRNAAKTRTPCFLSTPNLNFAMAALGEPAFRDSVVRSDLSIADGMPLVWVARMMGLPLRERVAGSTVFNHLETTADDTMATPLRVFFFGGPDGVAARAAAALNAANHPSMICVGHESPGFGSVEQMSDGACIDRINATGADFVIVALGARKGQAWIQHNRHRLAAPVISHLGAVVNFVAGTVRRAPMWVQRLGMEWAWRIKEEPALWRRYAADGKLFARVLFTCVVPGILHQRRHAPTAESLRESRAEFVAPHHGGTAAGVLHLAGPWTLDQLALLRPCLDEAAHCESGVLLNIRQASYADAAVLAHLSLLWAHCLDAGRPWSVTETSNVVQKTFAYHCATYLLQPAPAQQHAPVGLPVPC